MEQKNALFEQMPVRKAFFKLALPVVLSMVVSLVYNMVDTYFIAKTGNAHLVAGVALGSPVFTLMIAVGDIFGLGGSSFISRLFGQKRDQDGKRLSVFCFYGALFTGVGITALLLLLRTPLLTMLGAQADTVQYARDYYTWIAVGAPFIILSFTPCNQLRTEGFANASMIGSVLGAVVNIVLDPVLIFGCKLGAAGAAIATVLSQAVGAAWIIRFLTGKKTILRLRRDYLRPEKQIILPVLALGISSFVMLSTESLLSISFSSSLARYGGDVAVGAMTVITSASQLCTLPIQGICQGGQPVMSFNFGAGKKDRVKQAFRFQLTLCLSYTTIFWLLMMLVPGAVAGIFTSDASLIDYTTWAMRIYMAGIFSTGVQIACQQSFMALGQAKVSLLLACLRKIILLIPLIFILPHLLPNPVFGVFLAEPVSDILAATITTITFFARFDKILDQGAARV